jgi:parallel beta-helix repeat protein
MVRRIVALWITLAMLIGLIVISNEIAPPAGATTIYVDDDGGADYTKIQDAIDNASKGDTIFVYQGTYYENIVIDKTISLVGENKEFTIIDGSENLHVININKDWVNVSDFTVKGSGVDHNYAGLHLSNARYCRFYDNIFTKNNIGIYLGEHTLENLVSNSEFSNNTWGIEIDDSFRNTISNNYFENNTRGVRIESYNMSLRNDINNNEFISNLEGVNIFFSRRNYITTNTFINNSYGIYSKLSDNNNISENIVLSNGRGIFLEKSMGNTVIDNHCSDNYRGIICEYSELNTILMNNVTENRFGIYLSHSHLNNIEFNTALSNDIYGLSFRHSANNNITQNIILSNSEGIRLYNSSNCIIRGNNLINNSYGIHIYESRNNRLLENIMEKNGIIFHGENISYWDSHFIDTTNTVNEKSVYYLKDQNAGSIPQNAGQIILVNCSNFIIENREIDDSSSGIQLSYSKNNTITNNNFSSNSVYGIFLYNSSQCIITHNIVMNTEIGIVLLLSGDANVSDNAISFNEYGVFIRDSDSCLISYNNASNNVEYGLRLYKSNRNIVTGNSFYKNNYGLSLENTASSNRIYFNNFINNTKQITDSSTMNYWDDGYPYGGNFWSDYTGEDLFSGQNQDIQGSDYIGDTPHIISPYSTDNYPLIKPTGLIPPLISLNSPTNNSKLHTDTKINFHITDHNLKSVNYNINNGEFIGLFDPYDIDITNWSEGLYIILIKAEDYDGNINEKWFKFIVDREIPTIVSCQPIENTKDVAVDTSIIVNFSEPMDCDSVEAAISIAPDIEHWFSWSDNNKTVIMHFSQPLDYDTTYQISIDNYAQDLAGQGLTKDYNYEFTTVENPKDKGFLTLNVIIIFILIIIFIMAIFSIYNKRRKKASEEEQNRQFSSPQTQIQITCPSCRYEFSVTKAEGPIQVQCPNCGTKGTMG